MGQYLMNGMYHAKGLQKCTLVAAAKTHTCCSKDAMGKCMHGMVGAGPCLPLAPDTCCAEPDCAGVMALLPSLEFSCGSVRGGACLLLCWVLEEAVVAGRPLWRASSTGAGRSAASRMVSEASEHDSSITNFIDTAWQT